MILFEADEFESEGTTTAPEVTDAESGFSLSILDTFILTLTLGFFVYWFVFRPKKQEIPTIKTLKVAPVMGKSNDPCFVNKMKSSGRNVVVFYGSQTGTGEEFAGRLSKDSNRYGMKGMLADPEECEMEDLAKLGEIENSLAIFCLATYGEGDPTDNAQQFYDWLQNGDAELNGLKYAVFSLGNKTYEHYNAMGIYVDKRLEELGATRVFENGLGDDDSNIEEDFVTWREKFWPAVCEHYGVTASGDDISIRQYSLSLPEDVPQEKIFKGEIARMGSFLRQKPPYDAKNPFLAPMLVNRELHSGGDRSCMHIELDITGSKIRYDAGDHVAVYPINDIAIVNALEKRLKVDLDQVFTLTNVDEEASKRHPFPCPCSYRTALSHYLDIGSPPRTHILKELADYTSNAEDKEFLLKMSSSSEEGKALYSEWVMKNHRNILAILEDLPSLEPPIDHICELLPRLQARYYSISSSPKSHPTTIHITAVLIEYVTKTGRSTKGVATRWLNNKAPASDPKPTVPIFVRKSQFRLPFKPTTPIIMIGPGTGLAPFRGFIQERHIAKTDGKLLGDTILYFGCRHKSEDFLYQEELEKYVEEGVLSKMHLAFSRDSDKKVYVQHLLGQNKDEVWKVLENTGHIYVCGDARNMAREVHDTLIQVVIEKGGLDKSQASEYVKKLQSKGRYSCDVWS